MINVSEEIKDLFRDGQSHAYSMTIEVGTSMYFSTPTLTITDAQIKSESAELKESLFSGETVKFGLIQTSQFTATLINVNTDLKGKYIRVKITYDADSVSPTYIPYGEFYVESFDKTAYSFERKLVAYDYSYFLNVVNPMALRARLGSDNTAIKMCYRVFTLLGLQYEEFESEVDYIYIPLIPNTTTYADILIWMGELFGGWWKCDRTGTFKFVQIDNTQTPESISDIRPKSCEHSGAFLGAYTGVRLHGFFFANGIGPGHSMQYDNYLYGQEGNVYEMRKLSPFLYGKGPAELDVIGARLLALYNTISYIPHKVTWDGRPYMECGDLYSFETDDDTNVRITITAPIIMRTLKGIGGLKDSVETGGSSYHVSTNRTAIKTERSSISSTASATSALADVTAENNIKFLTPQMTNTSAIADGSTSTVELFSFTVEGVQSVPVILHSMIEATVTTTISSDDYKDCVITCTLKLDNEVQKTWTETFGDGAHIFNADILLEDVDVGDHEITLSLAPVGGSLS